LERQKEAAEKGLHKAHALEADAKGKVDVINEKLSDIEKDVSVSRRLNVDTSV
jgi:hypothetical protein